VCILPTAAHESVAATQRALRDRMTAARRLALEDASLLSQDPLLPGRSGENSMISTPRRNCARALKCSIALLIVAVITARAGTDPLSSEIPQKFTPSEVSFDYVKRVAMIPMRDGVKLYTLILIPRGAQRAPILLTRTPMGQTRGSLQIQAPTSQRSLTAPMSPMRPSSKAATSVSCRTCAASTSPKATTS
jgi:predicted acyl esterase